MSFALADRWVWDAWYVRDGDTTHMFFLNAPKAVGNADHRHFYASIGHAVSNDLINWTDAGRALAPEKAPAWDDMATWTGSVIRRPDRRWMMFYTGISRAERGHVQRIGAALSDDLTTWTRFGSDPVLSADPRYHETITGDGVTDEACRDPFVFPDPDGEGWHMCFTARGKSGAPDARGVIGHAWSPDLENWAARPPVWQEQLYGELEVPDLFEWNGRWYLLFSTSAKMISRDYQARRVPPAETGTHYLVSPRGPLGPWRQIEEKFLLGDEHASLYVARHVKNKEDGRALIAFRNFDKDGCFIGELTDPIPLAVEPDGRIRVAGHLPGVIGRPEQAE